MKDEEMAEEYRKSLKQRLIDEDNFERLEMFDENVEESFLAGLKAGRPQWHDLRKDPNDLPVKEENEESKLPSIYKHIYLIYCGYDDFSTAKYIRGRFWDSLGWTDVEDVIAWCEIPTFDKE